MRAANLGAFTGATMGLLAGVVIANEQRRTEPLAVGPAVGALAGAGLGVTLGFLDPLGDAPPPARAAAGPTWSWIVVPGTTAAPDALSLTTGLAGRF
jgi:hypothetical protein